MTEKTALQLFERVPCTVLGDERATVSGLAYNSATVEPGDAFFCIVGMNVDGHTFAQDAIDRGASVVVAERKMYLADATEVCEVVVADSRRAMADASCAFYDYPSDAFKLVGITGTNGKTTTTYLVEHIAKMAGNTTGVIGTVGIQIDGKRTASARTTPESPDLQRMFAQMRDAGVTCAAMEVSSHALDLERTWGTSFAVTAFTNLTQDHLDYHKTFDAYFEAKALLFGPDYPARRVINEADTWGAQLAARCRAAGDDLITFGADGSDITWEDVTFGAGSTRATFVVRGERLPVEYPLVGRFNVENAACAIGIAMQLGVSASDAVAALASATAVPGRMQLVDGSSPEGITVLVDYAHTPDALAKAIDSVRQLAGDGRTLVVFGCGGDRDAGKRPIMGATALAADFAIVTSDNPRSEDPHAIIADIVGGMDAGADRYSVEPDRARAIQLAVDAASPGDVVLLAGKGHEDYQTIGRENIHFDDREVAARALQVRAARG
ncbi:UDP-N-acetylmuramoyl-L-alanyl-D-glutamate--2,6-diaminopimelate ligase [Adlercreutzia murintestinalis]|uniref:UDP-N-acetylmuramoyl-L-alanyl-D-glutamate--2, 6-diaminopimelate ligase n=1 Tax=Adlercreutzia murintestinalis TaxID=2941325 RepID=UPI002041666F|nr:UDP-N-acetylmuramoyl-L-alanyl-D-glutamate--2,6-diaminopimelate ligase [Adlercreutzia murintestinalis]